MVDIEMAAHGQSVIEIKRGADGKWAVVRGQPATTAASPCSRPSSLVTGPAAGHDRLKTKADPTGTKVIGTHQQLRRRHHPLGHHGACRGELQRLFRRRADGRPSGGAQPQALRHAGEAEYAWGLHHDRFDVVKEPNEANRFGWVVEIDPTDPTSTPKKRTALGRFKHEGAESIVAKDGRVVVYAGDDERFDYLYKFVTTGKFDPNNRAANLRPAGRGHAVRRQVRCRRHASTGCRWCTARAR